MEMKIEKALEVLNENHIKVEKTPEQIARRRERAKARRAAKKAPALANDDYESVSKEKEKIDSESLQDMIKRIAAEVVNEEIQQNLTIEPNSDPYSDSTTPVLKWKGNELV